ncbi:C40 family peptidase [Nonomuraea sp. NPDC049309]|uniref:C40 family peptidase n=1 Tax=Nonomuraea sp. NPDC049309 TaxID=3364350 RepID=UPI00371F138A
MTLVAGVLVLGEPGRPTEARPLRAWAPRNSPVAATSAPPQVAALKRLREPHLLVVADRSLPMAVIERVRRWKDVDSAEIVDAAQAAFDGRKVGTIGVNPSTFRAYTPKPTAASDDLWRRVAGGEMAVSFSLGTDGGLALGKRVESHGQAIRVGAHATMGLDAVDAVVSRSMARALGFPQNNALLVSAPKVDSAKMRDALRKVLPRGTQVVVLKPAFSPSHRQQVPAGRVNVALTAAASKLGAPYVWGAEGPDAFDCSGLIQWAFAQAGVRLPRVTHQQFASGSLVPFSEMRPGDLIFWRLDPTNPGYISHAAIYWGDGKMIQAPRTGDVVRIVPVHTRNLAGVVRVSN